MKIVIGYLLVVVCLVAGGVMTGLWAPALVSGIILGICGLMIVFGSALAHDGNRTNSAAIGLLGMLLLTPAVLFALPCALALGFR